MNSNEDILSLGQLISKLRKEKGYSQREFARISGLNNTTISRIENGETQHPDRGTIKLIAFKLNYDESELLRLIDYPCNEKAYKHAKLKHLYKSVKKIKRYSTVSFSKTENPEKADSLKIPQPQEETVPPIKVSIKGMRLITLRLEKNVTQKDLADFLHIDKTLISQYEGEILQPDNQTVERLADFFGVTVEYLTGTTATPKQSYSEPVLQAVEKFKATKPLSQGINSECIAIAKEIQAAGIDIKDVRAFIEMLKKYKTR